MLPLPLIHPELCSVSPPESGENWDAPGAWVGGWMDLRDGMATMSLDGRSSGLVIPGLDEWASHPDRLPRPVPEPADQPAPGLRDDAPDGAALPGRTWVECAWASPPEAVEQEGFDPSYAVDFWDVTNKQDWAACESVQRGMESGMAQPGPLSPQEDGVYQYVTMVARGYAGGQVHLKPQFAGHTAS